MKKLYTTEIYKIPFDWWGVKFTIDNQTFSLDGGLRKKEAKWFEEQLQAALNNLIEKAQLRAKKT